MLDLAVKNDLKYERTVKDISALNCLVNAKIFDFPKYLWLF
jgi:hypothetical protein